MQRPAHRGLAALTLACALILPAALPAPAAHAETPSEASVEVRTNLFFRVPDATVQRLLPAGWQPAPAASGPFQGANLILVLTDRPLVQDGEGKPIGGGTGQAAVLVVPARNPATGTAGPMVAAGFQAPPETAPGAYGVSVPAEIRVERSLAVGPNGQRRGQERWAVAAGEERLELQLRYGAGTPARTALEQRVYSARNPEFFRIYRVDQGADLLRGGGADRVEEFAFSAAGPRLGALFDGSERLVAVLSLPWYVRRVSLP